MKKIDVVNMNNLAYKAIGLYKDNEEKPIFFQTRFGIQTFFLRHKTLCVVMEPKNIDENIYFVRRSKIVEPNQIFFWDIHFKDVLEIPLIGSREYTINEGETVQLIFS